MPLKPNAPNPDFLQSPWTAFWYALENNRGKFAAMYLCIIFGNACAYSIPYFLKLIADRISVPGPTPTSFSDFSTPLILITVVLLGQEIFYRIGHVLEYIIVLRAFNRITSSTYQILLKRPSAYFEETFAGELNRRIEQIGTATKYFIDLFPWEIGWLIIASVMTIILLSTTDIWLVIVFVLWLLFFLVISYLLLRVHYQATQIVSEKQANLSGSMVDVLGNTSVVHAFGAEVYEQEHYRRFMDAVLVAERHERRIVIVSKFHQGMSVILLSISLTVTSILLFTKGALTVGDFIIVAATLPTFVGIIWNFGEIIIRTLRSYGELKNALESLNTDIPSIQDGDQELVPGVHPSIVFDRLSFSYPSSSEKVFNNLNLEIKPGTKVGLVGRSGAGKSTLIKLLLRSYDPTEGGIHIGTQDIRETTLDSLRAAISFVPQDTTLFHRTLYENILYAKPSATKEEVIKASKRAHAHDFIVKYPEGYDVLVGERGVKLSGGQRQRIAIARAMLKNSPILVLDEATSALDSESEEIVQKGLHELFEGRTAIAIAHRLSTLRSMDRIIVIEQGKIIEDGSPQELLAKKNGEFKTIWEHQKNGFVKECGARHKNMNQKAIIWDADGVLIKKKHLFTELLGQEYGMDYEKMLPFFTGVFRECVIGTADLKEELAKVVNEWGWKGTIDELMHFWFTKGTEFDNDMLALVKQLHDGGLPSYMASGQEKYRGEHIRHELQGIYLDQVFIAADIGYTKKQAAFWEYVYDAIGKDVPMIRKEEILYIDDGQDEIDMAQKFGFSTYVYDGDIGSLTKGIEGWMV